MVGAKGDINERLVHAVTVQMFEAQRTEPHKAAGSRYLQMFAAVIQSYST